MKVQIFNRSSRAAFTLLEVLVSSSVVTVAGAGMYLALTTSVNLFAKNSSMNVAHQQMLAVIQFITRDAHASVDTPELLNADLTPNTGVGPAAGVSFQVIWQRPFVIRPYNPGYYSSGVFCGSNIVTLETGSPPGPRPSPGQRIILPADDVVEENITAVAANTLTSSTYTDVTIQNAVWKDIITTQTMGRPKTALVVDKVAYVVVGGLVNGIFRGDLHFYTQQFTGGAFSWQDRGIRASSIASATPFSLVDWTYPNQGQRTSATGLTAADLFGLAYQQDTQTYWKLTGVTPVWTPLTRSGLNRSVVGRFIMRDTTYSNRGFETMDMPLTFRAPYRSRLTVF